MCKERHSAPYAHHPNQALGLFFLSANASSVFGKFWVKKRLGNFGMIACSVNSLELKVKSSKTGRRQSFALQHVTLCPTQNQLRSWKKALLQAKFLKPT
jgi:hypothetical protein